MTATNLPLIADAAAIQRRPLVEACLEAAAASNAVFTKLYAESALAAADRADAKAKAGIAQSPLAGLPVSIKDLYDVAGETTLAGSIVLQGSAPAKHDATAVARLRATGAAIIGKTNMTEFAFSGIGINPHYGTPANPADPSIARVPGGSSSGAAASVAAGMCVAGLGSDTGGSIRVPAALCGLVGFKPTMRRVSRDGAYPLSTSLDTVCAMTRSVQDCMLIDSIIADAPLAAMTLPLAGLRFAVPQTLVMDSLDVHVAASFSAALTRLSAAGAVIVEVPLRELAEGREINVFSPVESYSAHKEMLATREQDYDRRVVKRIRMGANYSQQDYERMQQARQIWITQIEAGLQGFDAMLLPTTAIVAPVIADLEASDERFFEANGLILRNPSLINLLDGCAISLPCHQPGTLPVGLSVAGPAMSDARVMAVALAIETVLQR